MIPLLDKEAFAKIECNRCGQCCTHFRPNNDNWNSEHDGALGVLEAYGRRESQGRILDAVYTDTFKTIMFYGQLEAAPAAWEGQKQHYRCGHYPLDEEGRGVCINYEDRPFMCSGFPYGPDVWNEERKTGQESVVGELWDKCSWRVRWLDFEVEQGLPVCQS